MLEWLFVFKLLFVGLSVGFLYFVIKSHMQTKGLTSTRFLSTLVPCLVNKNMVVNFFSKINK